MFAFHNSDSEIIIFLANAAPAIVLSILAHFTVGKARKIDVICMRLINPFQDYRGSH